MKVLALELSSARGSIAFQDGELDIERDWPNDRKNSSEFFEQLDQTLKQYGPPERIVVGLGPGSYAGTRIAISTAIGLQIATKADLVGLPSICAMDAKIYAVIGDARRQSFFFAEVRDNELVEAPMLLSEEELRDRIENRSAEQSIFAVESLPQFDRVEVRLPSARVLARLAQDAKRSLVMPPLEPMYLREPHITTPKPVT